MAIFVHICIFLFSAAIVWFFAGILIESVDRVARRFHKTGFSAAFFILGILTSISEISVAVNSTVDGVPQVSVGNLVGASFVILLFIIPFLAIMGKGIELKNTVSRRNLLFALAVIVLPALLVVDGNVTRSEGVLALLAYLTLVYAIYRQEDSLEGIVTLPEDLLNKKHATVADVVKIILGGGAIFIASHFLVEQAVYFSAVLDVPSSLMGLILLSIGTNVPELVLAARSVLKKHKEIAFGDYLGSAATNTPIFAFLVFLNGGFFIEERAFLLTALLMFGGLAVLYFFARSKDAISLKEGGVLILFYICFLVIQFINIIRYSYDKF